MRLPKAQFPTARHSPFAIRHSLFTIRQNSPSLQFCIPMLVLQGSFNGAFLVYPEEERFPLKGGIEAIGLEALCRELRTIVEEQA